MADYETIKKNIVNLCNEHPKAKDILKKVNGKRTYLEIAKIVDVHPTKCSSILNKAITFELLVKNEKYFKKTKELKHVGIDNAFRTQSIISKEQSIRIRKRRKTIKKDIVEKEIKEYFINNFSYIFNPFSDNKVRLRNIELEKAANKLFFYLNQDVGLEQLDGLSLRFYESFASYFSSSRIRKSELINAFSNIIKLFEPYVKKVAAIKTNDLKYGKMSLNKEVIGKVITFTSDINKKDKNYWANKPIHEASFRYVYPFRHKEAHEARDYHSYEIDKIVYYMLAVIIFINLDY